MGLNSSLYSWCRITQGDRTSEKLDKRWLLYLHKTKPFQHSRMAPMEQSRETFLVPQFLLLMGYPLFFHNYLTSSLTRFTCSHAHLFHLVSSYSLSLVGITPLKPGVFDNIYTLKLTWRDFKIIMKQQYLSFIAGGNTK